MGSGVSAPNESRSLQLKKCISFFEGKPIDASDVPSTVNAEQELQIIYDQLSNMFLLAAEAGISGDEINRIRSIVGEKASFAAQDPEKVILEIKNEIGRLRQIVVENAQKLMELLHEQDPWASYSQEEQWKRVKDESSPIITTEENEPDIDTLLQQAVNEINGPYVLQLSQLEINSFEMKQAIAQKVTNLDLSGNSIDEMQLVLPNNLRVLSVASNPLAAPPLLSGCCTLLSLDLSFCEVEYTAQVFLPLVNLRSLVMDGCGLSTLVDSAGVPLYTALRSLHSLSLQDNLLGDIDALEGLRVFQAQNAALIELDLRENEVCTSLNPARYKSAVLSLIPSLKMLDNFHVRTEGGLSLESLKALKEDVEQNGTVLENSCLEKEVHAALFGVVDNTIIS